MSVRKRDLSYLQRQLGVSKEDIRKAIAHVGNNAEEIEQYLAKQARPQFVQWLHRQNLMSESNQLSTS